MSGKSPPIPGETQRPEAAGLGPGGGLSTIVANARPSAAERGRGVFTLTTGLDAGRVMSVQPGQVVTLGRADECTFRFDDISLSRVHARMMRVGNEYVFHDAGSTNGSFINGAPATGPTSLRDGDRVQLGTSTTLRFALVTEQEEQALIKVYEASMRDGLTGVYNRKHLDERLDAEVEYATRQRSPLSVVLLDVDHFKRVNDSHGHLAGDAVLKHTAETLARSLRGDDFVARYGGEEFVVVARGVDGPAAVVIAERLRALVAQTHATYGGATLPVTASFGVASIRCCGDRVERTNLLAVADARLYQAKQLGRNRVVGPT